MKFEEFREGIFLNEVSLGGSPPIKGTLGDSSQGIFWLMLFSLSITKEHLTDFQKKNIYSGLSSFCQRLSVINIYLLAKYWITAMTKSLAVDIWLLCREISLAFLKVISLRSKKIYGYLNWIYWPLHAWSKSVWVSTDKLWPRGSQAPTVTNILFSLSYTFIVKEAVQKKSFFLGIYIYIS